MTRPSRNQGQLLIDAAKRLLPELSASGMSLKRVADEAGVNLGMFSYLFKTKSNFIRKVLDSYREDARENARREIGIKVPEAATSIEKLRYVLTIMGCAFRDHRKLTVALYRDILNQDPDVSAFLLSESECRDNLFRTLIVECQNDGYIDKSISLHQVVSFCIESIQAPIVIYAALERLSGNESKQLLKVKEELITDEAIAERTEMVLKGIASKTTNENGQRTSRRGPVQTRRRRV